MKKRDFLQLALTLPFATLAGTAITGCSGIGNKSGNGKGTITVALDWTPNTNHSGLFVARDLGYFAEEGIEVDLQQSDMAFLEMVGSGAAQFGIAAQEQVLQARAASGKVPVVSIAALVQHNTSGFISKKSSNITRPKDFEGKTYSGWGTELELAFIKTVMEKDGGDFSKVTVINQGATDAKAALETQADFLWMYYGWDGIRLELENYPTDFQLLQDLDPQIDFYSPTIITNEQILQDDPELAKRFLRATEKGYQKAIQDPKAAVNALIKEAPELDPALLKASQEWLNPRYVDDAPRWGEMKPETWTNFANWMRSNNLLDSDINPEDAYSNDYLP